MQSPSDCIVFCVSLPHHSSLTLSHYDHLRISPSRFHASRRRPPFHTLLLRRTLHRRRHPQYRRRRGRGQRPLRRPFQDSFLPRHRGRRPRGHLRRNQPPVGMVRSVCARRYRRHPRSHGHGADSAHAHGSRYRHLLGGRNVRPQGHRYLHLPGSSYATPRTRRRRIPCRKSPLRRPPHARHRRQPKAQGCSGGSSPLSTAI